MEKKFDFKTIAIACLLFFGFVFLLFYKFSSADDAVNHYATAIEIFDSQQSFEDFKSTLPNKILPEWYTETESMANMLTTLACFAMGDYIGVGEGLVTELSGQITGDPLFLEHFLFDYDSLCWVFDSDTDDFVKSKLDPLIYSSSEGMWYKTIEVNISGNRKYTISAGSGYVGLINYNSSYGTADVIVVSAGDTPSTAQFYFNGSYYNSVTTYSNYTGTKTSGKYSFGYYNGTPWNTFVGDYAHFSNANAALTDFFGDNPSMGGTSLIPGVSIRNNDFTVKPLSYPASVLVDYPNEITYPDYDPDDTRLTFEYTYNMEVPFWLKNSTTDPTSYELPTDYDFSNIEFEYDADPSYLAGAGIVQDVFEVLPSSLQGLILLFGAGSLAFIFLRG